MGDGAGSVKGGRAGKANERGICTSPCGSVKTEGEPLPRAGGRGCQRRCEFLSSPRAGPSAGKLLRKDAGRALSLPFEDDSVRGLKRLGFCYLNVCRARSLSLTGTRAPTRVEVTPSSPKRAEDSNEPPLCSNGRGEELGREREMCRGDLGWGPRISDLGGPSSGRLWGGRRTMSLLAVTGQSKKTRVTITLATRQQAKLSLSVLSLSPHSVSHAPHPPPTALSPYYASQITRLCVCEEARGN